MYKIQTTVFEVLMNKIPMIAALILFQGVIIRAMDLQIVPPTDREAKLDGGADFKAILPPLFASLLGEKLVKSGVPTVASQRLALEFQKKVADSMSTDTIIPTDEQEIDAIFADENRLVSSLESSDGTLAKEMVWNLIKQRNYYLVDEEKRIAQILESLLFSSKTQIDVNGYLRDGETLLTKAIKDEKYEIVSVLLTHHDINVNQLNRSGQSPLQIAIDRHEGSISIARNILGLLLARPELICSFDIRGKQYSLIYYAAELGVDALVKKLLPKDLFELVENAQEYSFTLGIAIAYNHSTTVGLLLEAGVHFFSSDWVLHQTRESSFKALKEFNWWMIDDKVVKQLARLGILRQTDIDKVTNRLDEQAKVDRVAVITEGNFFNKTIFDAASKITHTVPSLVYENLLVIDEVGNNLLHNAVYWYNLFFIEWLLRYKPILAYSRNLYGQTPLDIALVNNSNSFSINNRGIIPGQTPLDIALASNSDPLVINNRSIILMHFLYNGLVHYVLKKKIVRPVHANKEKILLAESLKFPLAGLEDIFKETLRSLWPRGVPDANLKNWALGQTHCFKNFKLLCNPAVLKFFIEKYPQWLKNTALPAPFANLISHNNGVPIYETAAQQHEELLRDRQNFDESTLRLSVAGAVIPAEFQTGIVQKGRALNKRLFSALARKDCRYLHDMEQRGFSLVCFDPAGQSLLHRAAMTGNIKMIEFLLSKAPWLSAMPNTGDFNPIRAAIEIGKLDAVWTFLVAAFLEDTVSRHLQIIPYKA